MNKESIKAIGDFDLQIICSKTGQLLEHYNDRNLVVSLGHRNLAKLIGGDAEGKKIAKIAVGTNGTPPSLTDSGLTGMFSKAITSVTYPTSNQVVFNWQLDDTEANGIIIRELGLLNEDNSLFARKVRAEIIKTSDVRLVGTWRITFN